MLLCGCFGVVGVMVIGDAALGPAGALAAYALLLVVPVVGLVARGVARRDAAPADAGRRADAPAEAGARRRLAPRRVPRPRTIARRTG